MTPPYRVVFTSQAKKALASVPEKVAHACLAFITGPLTENPHRVGKPLLSSWEGHDSARRNDWRIVYTIDDGRVLIEIVAIKYRADAYRPR